jgi:hypothetical protein
MVEPNREVFPPEPPVANAGWPERRTDGKGAPGFGAAQRTLAVEHRSGMFQNVSTGGTAGTRSCW